MIANQTGGKGFKNVTDGQTDRRTYQPTDQHGKVWSRKKILSEREMWGDGESVPEKVTR